MKKTYKALSAGELSEDMYGRYDVDKFGTGCKLMKNWIIMAQGGAFFRPGLRYVAMAGDSSKLVRLIPFEFSVVQAYVLEFGDQYMRVYRNGGQVLNSSQNIVSITLGNPTTIEITGHGYSNGAEFYIADGGGVAELEGRSFVIENATTDTFDLPVDSTNYTAYSSGGSGATIYEIATPFTEDDLFDLYYSQTADVMTICHPSYKPRELSRTGHTSWTLATSTFAPSISAPTGESAAWTGSGSPSVSQNYKVTAVKEDNFEESLPSGAANVTVDTDANWIAGEYVTISWSSVTDAVKYNIYKEKAGTYGYIGSSESTSFIDDKIAPDVSNTPPRARDPFNAAGDYPSTVNFYKQRRVFGGTDNNPDTIYMSRSGVYSNMSVSIPNKDDDAITFAIASGQVNTIRHLIPFRELLAMTLGAEWKISSDGALTPTSVDAVEETAYGNASVPPIKIGNTAIFVDRFSRSVRDYTFTFEADGYDGNDLTVLSKHLFKDAEIVDWCYANSPDRLIWAVLSDGTLASLTYMREHRVWGWARHETNGFVESVCAIPNPTKRKDEVYFLVKRTIGEDDIRFIEYLEDYIDTDTDFYFLDCGVTYDGAAIDTMTGLWHLEGRTVRILADGNVLPDTVVENGEVPLNGEYSVVHAGLSYEGELQPMHTESDQGYYGATKGDPKEINMLYVEIVRTRGLKGGQSPDDEILSEMLPVGQDGDLSNPLLTASGIVELPCQAAYNQNYVAPYIKQEYPLPAKVLTITPNYVA